MTRPLEAIFFDIDDTLFSTSVFADKARRAAIDAMIKAGLETDRAVVLRELEEVIGEFTSNHEQHFDKVVQRLPAAATRHVNPAIIVAAGVVAYHETKWRELQVYDDVYDVLRWLATTDIVRGIISQGWTIKQAEKIIRLKIYDFLSPNAIFFTDQIGINKPNPKLYARVLATLGLEPDHTIYVGDNPKNDIDPAHAVGMRTIRVRRSGKYIHDNGSATADHEIRDFYELRQLLETEYAIQAERAG